MEIKANKKKIAIIGDVIIDKYKYYKAVKLSPEGPAPIVKSLSNSLAIGGAGNVAISLSNLGLDTTLYFSNSLSEREETISFINTISKKYSFKLESIISNLKNAIPIKIRYYVDGKQFMREDLEESSNLGKNFFSNEYINNIIKNHEIIVISDYQKGLINTESMKNIINACNLNNVPLFIDTKNKNFKAVENSYCLKINEFEFNLLFVDNKINFGDSIEVIHKKLDLARKSVNVVNLILTLGSRGSFIANQEFIKNINSEAVDVVDITGAGDAFLSALVYSFSERFIYKNFSSKLNFINSEDLNFANTAAASVISLKGTEPVSKDFLSFYKSKIKVKKKIGFTNGCFDLLHVGHLSLFKEAKSCCEYLIVGLNSDNSVRRLKGKKRPINDQQTRYEILKSIKYIDEVIIFDEDTPLNLIKEISPDLLIKGMDYSETEIIGAEFVRSYGGSILRAKIIEGKSTTNVIKKLEI